MKIEKRILLALSLSTALAACAPNALTENAGEPRTTTSAIIGGQDIPNDHEATRHIVGLYETKQGFICTGTLIGDNLVLTAAHCIPDNNDVSNMVVVFGNQIRPQNPSLRAVAAFRHPNYAPGAEIGMNDIAVLAFEAKRIPEAYRGLPIYKKKDLHAIRQGTKVMMLGYGLSSVDNGGNGAGAGQLRMSNARVQNPLYSPTEILLDQSKGTGTCMGDSGGPIIIMVGANAHILGVTSRGSHLCNSFGIYTSAGIYAEWITEAAKRLLQIRNGGRNNTFNGL